MDPTTGGEVDYLARYQEDPNMVNYYQPNVLNVLFLRRVLAASSPSLLGQVQPLIQGLELARD